MVLPESRSLEKILEKRAAQGTVVGEDIGNTMSHLGSSQEALVRELQKIATELARLRQDYRSIDCQLNVI